MLLSVVSPRPPWPPPGGGTHPPPQPGDHSPHAPSGWPGARHGGHHS